MTTPLYDWIYHQYAPATALPTPQQPLVELHEFPIYNTSNNNEIIGSYRGLRATQPIEAGQIILCIPRDRLMTAEELQAEQISQHGNGCSNEKVLCNQHALLTLWLMQEHQLGDESKWHAYLQSLPLPSVELLPALSTHYSSISTRLPWNLRELIGEQRERIQRDFQSIRHCHLSDGSSVGQQLVLFKWAWSMVNTRCVHIKRLSRMALVPLFDMFNHHPEAETLIEYDNNEEFLVRAHCDYRLHEQVFINYGAHDNHRLWCEYGFMLPTGNHCNFINLTDCLLECFDYRDADECHLMVADSKQVAWPLVLVLDRLVEQLPSLTKREILQRLLDCYRDRYCSDDFSVASEFIGFFKQSALDAMEIINTIGRLNSAGELW